MSTTSLRFSAALALAASGLAACSEPVEVSGDPHFSVSSGCIYSQIQAPAEYWASQLHVTFDLIEPTQCSDLTATSIPITVGISNNFVQHETFTWIGTTFDVTGKVISSGVLASHDSTEHSPSFTLNFPDSADVGIVQVSFDTHSVDPEDFTLCLSRTLSPPTSLTVVSHSASDGVRLSWNGTGAPTWVYRTVGGVQDSFYVGSATTFHDPGATTPNTTYSYSVRHRADNGCGMKRNSALAGPVHTSFSAPLPLSVSITGDLFTSDYETCQWTAIVSGGQPPYTYEWTRSDQRGIVGTGATYVGSTGGASFTLSVTVYDSGSASASDSKLVTVFPGGPLACSL